MKIFSLTILFMLPITSIYAMDSSGAFALKEMLQQNRRHSSNIPKFSEDKGNSKKPNQQTLADQPSTKKQR